MALPALIVVPISAAAPWLMRMLVKWAWGPLIVGLGYLLKTRIGLFIATAFVWLGINWGTLNLVMGPTIEMLEGFATNVGTGSGDFYVAASGYLGILNMDKAITMIISAVVTKHTLLQGRLFLFKRGVGA
jgi:hypothetical protein